MSIVSNVKKIGILRSGALGDVIVTLPAVEAIKNAYPFAEIILIGKPWVRQFIDKGVTPFHRFIEIPIKEGIRDEKEKMENKDELKSFMKRMNGESFDIIIQLQGNGKSTNSFVKQFGASLTVGMVSPGAELLDRFIPYYYYQNEQLRFLEVVKLIGAQTFEIESRIKLSESDQAEAGNYIKRVTDSPFIVLHPFSNDLRRNWPLDKFVEVGNELCKEGFAIIFSGSEDDKIAIDDAVKRSDFPMINSSGSLSLFGLAGLLSKSTLVISSDTGPLHLARAVGAKTVGIYWAPNLINWGPLYRANHRPVVCWKMECPICGVVPNNPYPYLPSTETCNHNLSFVREVKISEVLEAAETLLFRDPQKTEEVMI